MGYSIFDETMVDMPWTEVKKAVDHDAGILLPVGIIEEHGPHLGLAVDTYSAYLVAVKVKHLLDSHGHKMLIAPPQYWGISQATSIFPGTFSISTGTMHNLIIDIVSSLAKWGFKKVFTINWHADKEHCRVLFEAIAEVRKKTGIDARFVASEMDMKRLFISAGNPAVLEMRDSPPIDKGAGKYIDIHAGSMETAVMMRYFPEGIDPEFVKKLKPARLTRDNLKSFGKSDEETMKMIPDGYFGDPASYDMEAAEAYIEAVAKSYAEAISGYLAE